MNENLLLNFNPISLKEVFFLSHQAIFSDLLIPKLIKQICTYNYKIINI